VRPTGSRPSPARARWLWALPIVVALVLVGALGTVLARSDTRLAGTNSVPLRGPAFGVQHGEQFCQPGQILPKGAGRMRMFLSPAKPGRKPEVRFTISQKQDGVIARAPGRYRPPGGVDVTIDPPIRHNRVDGVVCMRNIGKVTVVMSGILTPFGNVQLHGKKLDASLTTLWYRPQKQTWLSELGSVIPRVGFSRVGGGWAFWVAGLLLLSAIGLALVTAIRENTR
jgi:hypothetical protein